MITRRFVLVALLLWLPAAASFGDDAPDMDRLKAEYYRLIATEPAAARKVRDRYMDLVNSSGRDAPFFSFIIGSQWPGSLDESKFPSRKGKFPQLQACRTMVESGSDILKILPQAGELKAQGIAYEGPGGLGDLVQTAFYREILSLPYSVMLFWAHGGEGQDLHRKDMSTEQRDRLYREFYDFTRILLTDYDDSGKTFLIGNWEGDWLAGGYGIEHKHDIPDESLRRFREWLDVRTRAIDDAKAATPYRNVAVYSYLEVNSTACARTKNLKRLVNEVLPYSSVDFVSVSSYDAQGFHSWPEPWTEETLRPLVAENLDYIESMLPPRDVPGKRVFIGEIGYTIEDIAKKQGITRKAAEKEQARLALTQAKVNMEWGVPLWLWWATFSSHEGTFGLVDNHTDEPSILHLELRKYYAWAREFTSRHRNGHGKAPSLQLFREAAMTQIDRQLAEM